MRLDVSYWRRRVQNAGDPNVFFGTTIIFPNPWPRAGHPASTCGLELPRRRGWSGYLSYANSRVVQFGPVTGGLFLEEEVIQIGPGTAFTPDHDQRNVGAFGVNYESGRTGSSLSFTGRYESGTPLEVEEEQLDELVERPGAELVDFERGRVRAATGVRCLPGPEVASWTSRRSESSTCVCSTSPVSVGPTTSGIRSAELTLVLAERSKSACEPASANRVRRMPSRKKEKTVESSTLSLSERGAAAAFLPDL